MIRSGKVNIAFILDSFLCCGGNKVALEQAVHLQRAGHSVDIFQLNEGEPLDWFIDHKLLSSQTLHCSEQLSDYDAVIAIYYTCALTLLASKTRGAKFWFVQGDDRRSVGDSERHIIEILYKTRSLNIFTEARWIQKMFLNEFGRFVEVIPNGINLDIYYPEPGFMWKEKTPLIITEGYVSSEIKGIDLAAEALDGVPITKWLVTSQTSRLPEFTKVFDRIIVRPHADEMRRLLSDATIFLKSSRYEGSPLPHLEAMACGTCLVATTCRGTSEYCRHMVNSWLVPNENVAEIRRGVEFLLDHPVVVRGIADRGRKFAVENLDWQQSIGKLEHFLIAQSKSFDGRLDDQAVLAINSVITDDNFKSFKWHKIIHKKNARVNRLYEFDYPSAGEIKWVRDSVMSLTLGTTRIIRKINGNIMCSRNLLAAIRIMIGTHRLSASGELELTVKLKGKTIRKSSLVLDKVNDNSWIEFVFDPIAESYGVKYTLECFLKTSGSLPLLSIYTYERNPTSLATRLLNRLNSHLNFYQRPISFICGYL